MKNIKLELSDTERKSMRQKKVRKSEISTFASEQLSIMLNISEARAKEIRALAEFQQIPSIGIEFAKDLVFLGLNCIEDLKGKTGAELTDIYEKKKGYQTDSCVEDQFRLAVDFAENSDFSKKWWDFTDERKSYRSKFGYPEDRPEAKWMEVLNTKN